MANNDAKSYPTSSRATTAPMQLVHTDLSGPLPTRHRRQAATCATYLDDYSGYWQ